MYLLSTKEKTIWLFKCDIIVLWLISPEFDFLLLFHFILITVYTILYLIRFVYLFVYIVTWHKINVCILYVNQTINSTWNYVIFCSVLFPLYVLQIEVQQVYYLAPISRLKHPNKCWLGVPRLYPEASNVSSFLLNSIDKLCV